jgi:SAM-dependent methyltransferase
VLDVGSGVGDVAMLAAKMVGPSGSVTCVERDPASLSRARSRAAAAGLGNLSFIEGNVENVTSSEAFDAAVGRLVLQYVSNPAAVVHSLAALVRPGGVMAFQDVWPLSLLHLNAHLPLRAKCARLMLQTFERAGVHLDMELVLYRAMHEAGLLAPHMRIEVPVGDDPYIVRWLPDLFSALLPRMVRQDLDEGGIGQLDTLESRLEAERVAARSFTACVGLASGWATKPA